MTEPETIKHRLVKARSALGWTQQDLANASGVAAAQISRYEAGRNKPRSEMIAKLAKSLNVQFDYLAHGRGPVEGDDPDRPLPPGIESISLDVSDEELERIKKFALKDHLTIEMAIRKLFLTGLANSVGFVATAEKSAVELLQEELASTKVNFQELAQRISKLEDQG